MSLIIGLFLVGVLLLAFEVFLPGGVIGTLGGISIIAGIVMSYRGYGSEGLVASIFVALALVVLMLIVEIKILPKTSLGKRFFLQRRIEGTSQPEVTTEDAVGQICQTITALSPTGYILYDGKRVEASSKTGFIEKNESVKIVGKETFRLLVSKI
tara:strand:- start:703 stop:1167 length:465 start_codon:yes stop_codon:yes gene_type:complete